VALLSASLLLCVVGTRAASALPISVSTLELVTTGPETEKSFYQVSDGAKKPYGADSSFDLVELDFQAEEIRIHDFFMPGLIWNIGLSFRLTSVPSLLEGSIQILDDLEYGPRAELDFPDIQLGFRLNRFEGVIDLALTTGSVVIPAGCAGREQDQIISGSPLDLETGYVELVAAVCPYSGLYRGDPEQPESFDEAFRIFLRGTITDLPDPHSTPEPGTLVLLAGGLVSLALLPRGKRLRRSVPGGRPR
jgi:hypothetical protein